MQFASTTLTLYTHPVDFSRLLKCIPHLSSDSFMTRIQMLLIYHLLCILNIHIGLPSFLLSFSPQFCLVSIAIHSDHVPPSYFPPRLSTLLVPIHFKLFRIFRNLPLSFFPWVYLSVISFCWIHTKFSTHIRYFCQWPLPIHCSPLITPKCCFWGTGAPQDSMRGKSRIFSRAGKLVEITPPFY